MGLLDKLLKKAAEGISDAIKDKADDLLDDAVESITDKAADNIHEKIKEANEEKSKAEAEKAAAEEAVAPKTEAAEGEGTAAEEKPQASQTVSDSELENLISVSYVSGGGAGSGAGGAGGSGGSSPAGQSNYMHKLEDEWKNQKEEGYVYTINISDASTINAFGLASAKYKLNLSCSHVGTSPLGVYHGFMGFYCTANFAGTQTLLALLGGGMQTKKNLWFRNDNYFMKLAPYLSEDEDMFKQTLGKAGASEQEQSINDSMGSAIMAANGKVNVESPIKPLGYWCDWEYRMTEGDMSDYANVFVYGGLAHGSSTLSNDGHSLQGNATATFPFIGTFKDNFDEIIDGPFPYQLKFYDSGKVTIELFGTNSTTVAVRFNGTWDKVPVGETTVVG